MMKRLIIILALAAIALGFFPLAMRISGDSGLTALATHYVEAGADELGAANLVTSVVVSYRGLDTLGEVMVLFTATTGVTALLVAGKSKSHKKEKDSEPDGDGRREGSELLATGAAFLFPILILFGIYIFLNGHLTPGGGFQGGVVLASAFLLLLFSDCRLELNHALLKGAEAISGAAYVAVGLLGLWLAGGFLDPRFLPAGEFGQLFSAGAIPIIYILIGIKVGSELTGIVDAMRRCS
ncbi:MAG: sodium:proton antiporter [Spirochaetae bacterium HGW-Spirochaetae-4]|nr:MAG: sodium:proton antiporter [Spirochaetae bacterium HGW-Spirochaetae-4]HCG64519.1 sodium:proton antiporter [Sphaerochaeta sp.]HCS35437.1 sodium:proton antiporter [Sphaerochaeta sp.]